MAKTFIDMVQQVNDAGWIVGDCFQLKMRERWIWRVHLRDYAKRADYAPASVYAEHPVLETVMASCVEQMQQTIKETGLSATPAPKTAGKVKPSASLNEKLLSVLTEWCRTDDRFGDAFLQRVDATEEV